MPLLYKNKQVELHSWMYDFYDAYPDLNALATDFARQEKRQNIPCKGFVYVSQREWATVLPNHGNARFLGSSDATTCQYLIIRHTGSGAISLGHFDGESIEQGVNDMIKEVKELSAGSTGGRLEVSMVGGFPDERNMSTQISQDLISAMTKSPENLNLVLFCVVEANSTFDREICDSFPIILDVVVDVQTGEISPALLGPAHKQPVFALRHAINFQGKGNLRSQMRTFYDSKSGQIKINPVDFDGWKQLSLILKLPDSELLQHFSTSPAQEPPHFASELRVMMQLVNDHPTPRASLFNQRPMCFEQVEVAGAAGDASVAAASADATAWRKIS